MVQFIITACEQLNWKYILSLYHHYIQITQMLEKCLYSKYMCIHHIVMKVTLLSVLVIWLRKAMSYDITGNQCLI